MTRKEQLLATDRKQPDKTVHRSPGPWYHDNEGRIYDTNDHLLATCIMHHGYRISDQRMQANAGLIAAAPDLLEACQYLLNLCERHTPGLPESNENEGKEWKRSMAIARKAITKAKLDT